MALPPLGPSGREADDAQWLELTGKSGMAINVSPVHRLRISGPGPNSLTALPKDNRPVNRERGEAILAGRWKFGAAHIETPEGRPKSNKRKYRYQRKRNVEHPHVVAESDVLRETARLRHDFPLALRVLRSAAQVSGMPCQTAASSNRAR